MPPPPPVERRERVPAIRGFTKDELTSQLSDIGSSDSTRSSLISNIINNFDEADTDSDGKVSFQKPWPTTSQQFVVKHFDGKQQHRENRCPGFPPTHGVAGALTGTVTKTHQA